MSYMDNLPDVPLLKILNELNLTDIINVKKVSIRFRNLPDAILFNKVTANRNLSTTEVAEIIRNNQNYIREINLLDRSDAKVLLNVIRRCESLQTLRIKNCDNHVNSLSGVARKLTPIPMYSLKKILVKCVLLKNLEITNSNFDRNAINLPKNSILKSFKFAMNSAYFVTPRPGTVFGSIHREYFEYAKILRIICEANAETLTELKLSLVKKDQNNDTFSVIGKCGSLETLDLNLTHAYHPQPIFNVYLEHLSSLIKLKHLRLSNLRINEEFYLRLMKTPQASNFLELTFQDCNHVNSNVIRQIGKSCPRLIKICVNQTYWSPKKLSIEDASGLVENCKKLRYVYFLNVDTSVREILHEIPIFLQNLRELQFSDLDIQIETWHAIRQRHIFINALKMRMKNYAVSYQPGNYWRGKIIIKKI